MYTLMPHFKVEEIQTSIPPFSFECTYSHSVNGSSQDPMTTARGPWGLQSHNMNEDQSMVSAKCSIVPKTWRVTHTAKLWLASGSCPTIYSDIVQWRNLKSCFLAFREGGNPNLWFENFPLHGKKFTVVDFFENRGLLDISVVDTQRWVVLQRVVFYQHRNTHQQFWCWQVSFEDPFCLVLETSWLEHNFL